MTPNLAARMLLTLALAAVAAPGFAQSSAPSPPRSQPAMSTPRVKHLTPVLVVEQIEPCLKFWSERFGFQVENQVPGPDGKLVFASVAKDGVEVMYQTKASVLEEDPNAGPDLTGHTILFLTVDDIDAVEKAVAGAPVVRPRHQTFYGSTEIYVREPGGHTVGFAQFTAKGAAK